jgi:6-hydroxytryprostatin B O-methyltransferase
MASLEDLASVISSKSSKISSILKENSIPTPSFKEESFADFEEIPGSNVCHESLRVTRNELISAAQDIIRLAMGPVDHLLSLAWSVSLITNLPSLGSAPC